MQKKIFTAYFAIFLTLLFIMSLSTRTSEKIRGASMQWVTPLMENILSMKHFIIHPQTPSPFTHITEKETLEQLHLENLLLHNEIRALQNELREQAISLSQAALEGDITTQISHNDDSSIKDRDEQRIYQRLLAKPARVVFRTLDDWYQSLWINIGEKDNENTQSPIVAVHSPVIIGQAVVGVIDYVGEHQSRVRLISDARLKPSVRVARGGKADLLVAEYVERILEELNVRSGTSFSQEEQARTIELLKKFKECLQPFKKTQYLAKGQLEGSLHASNRFGEVILKGTGFNYDFSDGEGERRDLRTGKIQNRGNEKAIPILKPHDLLVTTGMDGVFPAGFQVARVLMVNSLKEGDYYFDIEAKPVVGNLEELSLVFVLPPVSQEKD